MVKIYVRLIRAGKMTLGQVPEKWRDAVAEALGGVEAVARFSGLTPAEVLASLSYRPTKQELLQACGWLGLTEPESATNAELLALLRSAAGVE